MNRGRRGRRHREVSRSARVDLPPSRARLGLGFFDLRPERGLNEGGASRAVGSDMSKVKLLTWFNENGKFKINTSTDAQQAYSIFVWNNPYFKTGTSALLPLFGK